MQGTISQFKSLTRTHKAGSQNKTKPCLLIIFEIMYKTKFNLARHTNSEKYIKVKTKLKWKI